MRKNLKIGIRTKKKPNKKNLGINIKREEAIEMKDKEENIKVVGIGNLEIMEKIDIAEKATIKGKKREEPGGNREEKEEIIKYILKF